MLKKQKNGYSVLDHKKKFVLNELEFNKWIHEEIISKSRLFMIQKYIKSRTNQGEPFDIRAHVQKDGQGKWQITKIYPRIGNKKSILSNISRGGRTEELTQFLTTQYGTKGKEMSNELRKLAMGVTKHLDQLYGAAIDELGLDLTIDEDGKFWMHEVNNGPQSAYHEHERAANTIAYAIYLAENGLFFSNKFDKRDKNREFIAETSNLEIAKLNEDQIKVGMLVNEKEINKLVEACAYVAKFEEQTFYYFTPKDIDYEEKVIRGYFYENKEWVPKLVEYPDVIYDRLRTRGLKGFEMVYRELEEIPFTNEFFGNSISKLEVYNQLRSTGMLDDYIIPYKKVERVKDIFHYLNNYERIILKPEVGSFANGVHYIEKVDHSNYLVALKEQKKEYSELGLNDYLRSLVKKGVFIVQEYIETRTKEGNPFDIRVHLMKDGSGDWSFVESYPRIGVGFATILVPSKGGYMSKLTGFLQRNFENKYSYLESKIKEVSHKIAVEFEHLYQENVQEVALDLAIDPNAEIKLIEVNVNKPGINYYEFEVAKHVIPYAIQLAKKYRG
ncbi:YheC/YheD family protein [Bacillus sp. JCM 19034]|uniref:YheC/YheD family protein n=1 Tax=Bacillus sp. JCM 19034 TaxID=1481928 RepID=UPI000781113F|nr:YheC/YheD family protein [Bacillus sp. JCM 19034]